jgi:hypothetical protein
LLPEGLKGAEISLSIEESLDRNATGGSDQLVLQILLTDEESQSLHLDPILWRTETRSRESTPNDVLFGRVTHSDDGQANSFLTEADEKASHRMGTADRHDHDFLCCEIPPLSAGECLDCDLIADPLDQDDGPRGF